MDARGALAERLLAVRVLPQAALTLARRGLHRWPIAAGARQLARRPPHPARASQTPELLAGA